MLCDSLSARPGPSNQQQLPSSTEARRWQLQSGLPWYVQKGRGIFRRTDPDTATDLKTGEEVAVKLEHHSIDPSLLRDEFDIYKSFAGGKGIPKV